MVARWPRRRHEAAGFHLQREKQHPWTPTNSSVTTLNVTEELRLRRSGVLCNAAACAPGWYTAAPVTVTHAAADAGAGLDQIRYTTDGTDPTILPGNVYVGRLSP